MRHYTIVDSAACMPASCWGSYRRVGVVEVDSPSRVPTMLSTRAKGVLRIVQTWERLHVGSTDRCAYRVALAEAEALLERLSCVCGGDRYVESWESGYVQDPCGRCV